MESIALQSLVPEPIREGKARGILRKSPVKGRVKARDLYRFGKVVRGLPENVERARDMQRSEYGGLFELLENRGSNPLMLTKMRTAVYEAMSNYSRCGKRASQRAD